jgi:hypothetical protein
MIQAFFIFFHDGDDEFFPIQLESSPMWVSETNFSQQSAQVHKNAPNRHEPRRNST